MHMYMQNNIFTYIAVYDKKKKSENRGTSKWNIHGASFHLRNKAAANYLLQFNRSKSSIFFSLSQTKPLPHHLFNSMVHVSARDGTFVDVIPSKHHTAGSSYRQNTPWLRTNHSISYIFFWKHHFETHNPN